MNLADPPVRADRIQTSIPSASVIMSDNFLVLCFSFGTYTEIHILFVFFLFESFWTFKFLAAPYTIYRLPIHSTSTRQHKILTEITNEKRVLQIYLQRQCQGISNGL